MFNINTKLIADYNDYSKENMEDICSVQCEVNKVYLSRKTCTGPDPRTLGASPNMQFLASAGPGQNTFLLSMLPDTGAGVTLLSERLMNYSNIKINKNDAYLYKLMRETEKVIIYRHVGETVMGSVTNKVMRETEKVTR